MIPVMCWLFGHLWVYSDWYGAGVEVAPTDRRCKRCQRDERHDYLAMKWRLR